MSNSKTKLSDDPPVERPHKWYSKSGRTEYTYWVDDKHNLVVDLPNYFRGSYRGNSRESVAEIARDDMKASKCVF
jgi:hypothetical protein